MRSAIPLSEDTQVTTGIPVEFVNRLFDENGSMPGFLRPTQPQIPNDTEIVKRVMIEMLREGAGGAEEAGRSSREI